MKFKHLILVVAVTLAVSCVSIGNYYEYCYELRVPKTAKYEPLTSFDVVADTDIVGTRLKLTKKKEDGDFVIFSSSTLIHDGQHRRAMVVTTDGQPAQVFRLAIPHHPRLADWTAWLRPDYTETTDATWTFLHDLKQNDRSTNIPPDCFELRYKIITWKP